jgi:hypothetical protein
MFSLSLAELQTKLQDYLLASTHSLDDITLETPTFTRQQRLAIYHDAYRLRLIDTLHNDFPALAVIIGEENFIQCCGEYIAQQPSTHTSLRWYGEKLPAFLRTHPHWQKRVSICELAAFEWAQIMAFDAEDTTPASLNDLRALHPSQWLRLQIKFQPSLYVIHCQSNAPELWSTLIKENALIKESDLIIKNAEEKIMSNTASPWLIWRKDLQVIYLPLSAPEYWSLQAFMAGNSFAKVCEGLSEWYSEEQIPLRAAQYLQQWLNNGLVHRLHVSDTEM